MKRLFLRSLWMCGAALLAGTALLSARADSPVQSTPENTAAAIATVQSDQPLFERAMACRALAIAGDAAAIDALAGVLDSHELAAYARHALEEMPDPAATEALLAAIDRVSPDLQVGILASLGRRRDNRAVPALARQANAEEPAVVDAALRGLADIASDDALKTLVSQVGAGTTRPSSLAAAILLAAERRGVDAHDVLASRALRHVDTLVKQVTERDGREDAHGTLHLFADAASAQLVLRHADDDSARLSALLVSDREEAFQLGVQAARKTDAIGVAALLQAFSSATPSRKIAILTALSDSKAPEALAVVLAASTSDDADLRLVALEALGRWPTHAGIERLLEALADRDAEVVATATAALATLDATTVDDAIVAKLNSADPSTLVAAATLAGSRGVVSAEDRLFALSRHESDAVARAAVLALGAVVREERYSALLDLIASPNLDRQATQAALSQAGQRLSREVCVPLLTHAIETADSVTTQSLLEVLGTLEGDAALKVIAAAAAGDDEGVVDTATRLLGRWSGPDAADTLVDLAQRLENETFQTRAVRGLLRIVRQFDLPMQRRVDLAVAAAAVARRPEEQALVTDVLRRYPQPRGLTATLALVGTDSTEVLETEALPIAVAIASEGDADSVAAIAQLREAVEDTPLEPRVTDLLAEARRNVEKAASEEGFVPLFDGRTFTGWHGNLDWFRIENETIIAGSLEKPIPRNEFLRTDKTYGNFELRLQFQLLGGDAANAGVQIRTAEIPDHHEVSGYQADMGNGWWGCLYDESRRNRVLAGPAPQDRGTMLRENDWNDYRIRCEGDRVRLWINDVLTVDYTETEPEIARTGIIAVQVHSGPPTEAWYRKVRLLELK